MGTTTPATLDKLVITEKTLYYRSVRRHRIPLSLGSVSCADQAKAILQRLFESKPIEGMYAVALNSSGDFLGMVKVAEGTVDRAAVYPRELVSFLLIETSATAVILAHSHPGGKPEPSHEDLALTTHLKDILLPLGVKVLDHFIYACSRPGKIGEWISLRERGDL